MESSIPEIQKIEDLIRPIISGTPKNVTYTSKPLTSTGENYGSLLLALEIRIEYENSEEIQQMVAKLCPTNEWLKRMFASHITFKKEIGFYVDIIPELIRFQEEHKIEEKLLNLFPKCLSARINLNPDSEEVDENAIILLENLKLKHYKLLNRHEGFSYPETVLVLKSLARFHAVPLAYKIQKPDEFKTKIMPLLNRVSIGQEMFDLAEEKFSESIYRHLNLTDEQLDRFLKGMKKGYDFQKNFPSGNEKYATIVHCDFWLNNTMIKFENEKPIANKMLDFQVNTYGSPFSDLVFFLFTSVRLDVIRECYSELLKVYYTEFNGCLKELHCDISDYTLESFMDEINFYGPLEASHILIMFKAVFTVKIEKSIEDMTMDDMFTNDGITDIYLNRLRYTVKDFFDKNWF